MFVAVYESRKKIGAVLFQAIKCQSRPNAIHYSIAKQSRAIAEWTKIDIPLIELTMGCMFMYMKVYVCWHEYMCAWKYR